MPNQPRGSNALVGNPYDAARIVAFPKALGRRPLCNSGPFTGKAAGRLDSMSTADQTKASELHGTALLLAQSESLQPLLDRLAAAAEGRDDIRTQEAGILAGVWFAAPGRHLGHELIAAGLLILAGVTDRDQLEIAVRLGYERGRGSLQGYDPTDATG